MLRLKEKIELRKFKKEAKRQVLDFCMHAGLKIPHDQKKNIAFYDSIWRDHCWRDDKMTQNAIIMSSVIGYIKDRTILDIFLAKSISDVKHCMDNFAFALTNVTCDEIYYDNIKNKLYGHDVHSVVKI